MNKVSLCLRERWRESYSVINVRSCYVWVWIWLRFCWKSGWISDRNSFPIGTVESKTVRSDSPSEIRSDLISDRICFRSDFPSDFYPLSDRILSRGDNNSWCPAYKRTWYPDDIRLISCSWVQSKHGCFERFFKLFTPWPLSTDIRLIFRYIQQICFSICWSLIYIQLKYGQFSLDIC